MLNLGSRRTKIVCTIGPATNSPEAIARLIDAGMNVARINFSHGTAAEHEKTIQLIRRIAGEKNIPVAILQDLSGPKIRIGEMKEEVELKSGDPFTLFRQKRTGDAQGVSSSYPDLAQAVEPGDIILLADGAITLKVLRTMEEGVVCQIVAGGKLSSHKGINLPSRSLSVPSLTEKDGQDLEVGIKLAVDFIALSFVRRPGDIIKLKNILNQAQANIPVIAKIEKHEALEALDEILNVSDGIMVARGDLAVETPLEEVPIVQKMIISKCNQQGKPVITATQMLKSMVGQPRPTRAEAADVANAVLDGTDAVMLSEETAIGHYPVETVRTMHKILLATEKAITPSPILQAQRRQDHVHVPAAVSHAAVVMARDLKASAIITPTRSGATARMVARFRPTMPVVALCLDKSVMLQLCLVWGVYPYRISEMSDSDLVFQVAKEMVLENGFAQSGETVIITAGLPMGTPGATNLIKVDELE